MTVTEIALNEPSTKGNGTNGLNRNSTSTLVMNPTATNGGTTNGLHAASNSNGNGHIVTDGMSDYGDGRSRRLDEYEVDFADTRKFAQHRWNDILSTAESRILPSDLEIVSKYHDWDHLSSEILSKIDDPTSTALVKREMNKILHMPKSLATMFHTFSQTLIPYEVKYSLVWALIYLNLKLSYASPDRLKRTVDLIFKIRRITDLFNRCLQACEEDNESRIAVVDFLDPLTIILTENITFLRNYTSDRAADDAWPDVKYSISDQMNILDQTVRHLNEITTLSKVYQDRRIKNLSLRHALIPEPEEHGIFPNRLLPSRDMNPNFYGRNDELEKITEYLRPKGDQSLRTYSIYGRRGVGKTEIALQFAHTNPCNFDALFWIQCETSVSIRQSFTKVAVALNLPGADSDGHHEENLLMVHEWLKRTKKRWLLIFDNAEKQQIYKQYWPVGGAGAILITSREYYNFVKDTERRGQTIKPFDASHSWDLLLQLLGEDWKTMERKNRIAASEINSAKTMLVRLGGLALAIQQAAQLIKNPDIGGPTIAKTYETFERRYKSLPDRQSGTRSSSEKALDTLWDMIFNALTPKARALLGVLAWLSPDTIQVSLFLPRNQKALDGPLDWCKQVATDDSERAALYTLITPTDAFEKALAELHTRDLVKKNAPRLYSIHRVVQEAVNYKNDDELQETFETAAQLVNEQFPNRRKDDILFSRWGTCQDYIQHGVHLSRKFQTNTASGKLRGSKAFVELLSNCAWYLHELGDYEVSERVLSAAKAACLDKASLEYADLRNTSGARFFEMNRLDDCRTSWEDCLKFREELLDHNHISIGAIYNNLGNLELAQGNVEESLECFDRATQIYQAHGDTAASRLALTYLCIGRARMLEGNLEKAITLTAWSEDLLARTTGRDKGFMANVYYAYGNIKGRQGDLEGAWREYDQCLKICLQGMSIHSLTVATYYSLGRVEFLQGHLEAAKGFLDKAKRIAELRSPERDDGPTARILWHLAIVLESAPNNAQAREAEEMRTKAIAAQQELLAAGEGGYVPRLAGHSDDNDEKFGFDSLVPLFFR